MKDILLFTLFIVLTFFSRAQTVTDIEGNVYNTIAIGNQEWMAENLKTTKYRNGEPIASITENATWITFNEGAYCWQNNDFDSNADTYGALYNGYVAGTGNICPTGWRVPSEVDWTILFNYLGGSDVAGGKLKETGIIHWNSPNNEATDEVGFTALPGGSRGGGDGLFHDFGTFGYWWSATTTSPDWGWAFLMGFNDGRVVSNSWLIRCGFSVRCIKDNITSLDNYVKTEEVIFYPNPVNDKLYYKNMKTSNMVMIFDLQGNMVLKEQLHSKPIDISNLRKGVYIIKCVDSGEKILTKLIKQ